MATPYKLRCNLTGHSQDVRALAPSIVPENGLISGSRDNTSRIWTENQSTKNYEQLLTMRGHTNFVSSLCVMPPDDTYPQGLIITGSNDKTILAYSPGEIEPVFKLTGHTGNVCALASGKFGFLLSGSWDMTARVWLNQKCVMVLEGHSLAVWAVGIISGQGVMLTGSADKTIKAWKAGKCFQTYSGHEDCVRGLAVVGESEFLSCANDATIRRWAVTSGDCLAIYYGHTNYVYSISMLPNGQDFITGSEDRTLRVWRDGKLAQTIYHPCESVWAVCALSNGDIATGASDGVIRMFTQAPERVASEEILAAHEASLASAPVASQPLGDIKIEDLPGPESLLKAGKKDGQTTMVNDNGSVEVYQWDGSQSKWVKVGNVVGSSGSTQRTSGKMLHNGKEYDYVFSVDIKEGAPPLKLPYNINEDPWMAAQRFLHENELSQMFLDQVANFIIDNTKGVTLSTGSAVASSDPFTGGDRYVPGQGGADPPMPRRPAGLDSDPFTGAGRYVPESQSSSEDSNGHFPITTCLFFDAVSPGDQIIRKLKEFNSTVEPGDQVSEQALDSLSTILAGNPSGDAVKTLDKLLSWSSDIVFPALDILRMGMAKEELCSLFCSRPDFIDVLCQHASQDSNPATIMLAMRTLANMFRFKDGADLNICSIDTVLQSVLNSRHVPTKNGQTALATLVLNYCVELSKTDDLESKSKCLQTVLEIAPVGMNSEALYRLFVGVGTLVAKDDGCKALAHSIDLPDVVSKCQNHMVDKLGECSKLLTKAFNS